MIVAIDLHNIRDGGGVNYMKNLLAQADPERDSFSEVHLIGAPDLLGGYPENPWLIKHACAQLSRSLPHRLWFVHTKLPRLLEDIGCDVLYLPGGVSLGGFRPRVAISRNMMPFRPEFWATYPWLSADRMRLRMLRWVNALTFEHADGMIYLSETARRVISKFMSRSPRFVAVIPHGVNRERFREIPRSADSRADPGRVFNLIYPSRLEPYKHQVEVVRATALLRDEFPGLRLTLCGPANPSYLPRVQDAIRTADIGGERISYIGEVANEALPAIYRENDLLLFGSSCENLPNILIEAMTCGIPICSSHRSPMPEIGRDACLYFDPTDPASIAGSIRRALNDMPATLARARLGLRYAQEYSWETTARRTFEIIAAVAATSVRSRED